MNWQIILRAKKNAVAPQSSFASTSGINTWLGGIVPYTFNGITPAHQQAFLDAANEWASFANLQFVLRTSQTDYVTMQNCACAGGNSAVGRIGGQQFIEIGSWNRGTLAHEIGHTLGLVHEHQRSDRESYVNILTANIIPGQEGNFTKLPSSVNQGAYDFYSVMHYARNALSVNPATLDTIQPQPAYSQFLNLMGQQNNDRSLSAGDRNGIAAVYGAPSPLPGAIVSNTKDSGLGSLRTAIYYAIDHPGTTISFNIPTSDPGYSGGVFTIHLSDQLTRLGTGTIIDGATQTTATGNTNPNGPEVVINGAQSENYIDGVKILEANCTVRGLVISACTSYGVLITGTGAVNNKIEGCCIGTDSAGSGAGANAFAGVAILGGATGNTIGGTTIAKRNVISGNGTQGVAIGDAATMNNLVQGNFIGLNAAGTGALANGYSGVAIYGSAQANTIGGTASGAGNVISGNALQGVRISDVNTKNNLVQGNFVGLNAAGSGAVPNTWAGVDFSNGAQSNTIGGTASGARNIISGNALHGVAISDAGTSGNAVVGNYIGLNPSGTSALANGWAGVDIFGGASANVIGGTTTAARNVISSSGAQGVAMSGPGTSGNLVQGNYIGLNAAGTAVMGNTWSGVEIYGGAQANTIGGSSSGVRNIISGNTSYGVAIRGDIGSGIITSGNLVQGNYIGVNPAGNAAMANSAAGVGLFDNAQGNTIGGAAAGLRNIISGNLNQGVVMGNTGTSGNSVRGNYIGLNAAGTGTIGNAWSGIDLFTGAANNVIGGTTGGSRNFICANGNHGVVLSGAGTTGNQIQGNTIGLTLAGATAGNTWSGVAISSGPQGNSIGGTTTGAGNIIIGNALRGVENFGTTSIGNSILGNSIYNHGELGINLFGGTEIGWGTTLNDPGDADTGPNNLQNFPVLTSAVLGATTWFKARSTAKPTPLIASNFSPARRPMFPVTGKVNHSSAQKPM